VLSQWCVLGVSTVGSPTSLLTSLQVVIYVGSHLVYNAFFHPLAKYPGPFYMTSTRLGFCQKLLSGFLPHTVLDLHKKYGPVVRIAPDQLSYAHPDAWKDIMGHHGHKKPEMGKYPRYYYAHPATPTHIMNAGRDDHSQMRKIFSHGFSEKAVREQEPIVQTYVDLFMKRLTERADGRKLDMASAYNYLFFDVIGNLAFGEE
jgi:cytochrome P450